MPQIVLEYSANLTPSIPLESALLSVNQLVNEIAAVDLENCKSRAYAASEFVIGSGQEGAAFAHLDVRFIEGRSEACKQKLGQALTEWIREVFLVGDEDRQVQVTVEVRDILVSEYTKFPAGSLTKQQ